LLAAFVACVAAVVMTRPVTGPGVIFQVAHHTEPPLTHLPRYLLLGLIAGLLGVVFDKCLMAGLDLFERIPSSGRVAAAGGVGAIMGVTAWWWPPLVGGGEGLAQASLRGELAISWLPMLLVVRLLLTVLSYGCGAPGGIFAPLLVLGALLGLGYAAAIGSPDGAGYAVVGMAAIFTAVVRAPLTGIVLIVEMTANYDLLLPMLVASLAAYRVADHLHDEPIYEALSARDRPRPSV
jgi:CIC family chloride channel protein